MLARRTLLRALPAAAWALGPAARVKAQQAPAAGRLRVRLSEPAALAHWPLLLAERLGYFRDAGVHPQWVQSGADVEVGDYAEVLAQQARGRARVAFVQLCRTPQVQLALSTRARPALRHLDDLQGLTLGLRDDLSAQVVAALALSRAGVRAKVSTRVLRSPEETVQALKAGRVQAVCDSHALVDTMERAGELRRVVDTRRVSDTVELFGALVPGACLHVARDHLQRHGPDLAAMADGVRRALRWLQTAAPTDLVDAMPAQASGTARAHLLGSFERMREAYSVDGRMDQQGPLLWLRVLQSLGLLDPSGPVPDPADTYTNRYLS